ALCLVKGARPAHGMLCFTFAVIGVLGTLITVDRIADDHVLYAAQPGARQRLRGKVISAVEQSGDKIAFRLAADSCDGRPVSGTVQVTLYVKPSGPRAHRTSSRIDYGDRIELICRLRRPHTYGNPGAFDYAAFRARQGVRVGAATADEKAFILERTQGNRFKSWVYGKRKNFNKLLRETLAADSAGLLQALITGDRSSVDREIGDRFAHAGAAHLLAISGLHIGFVVAFSYVALSLLLRYILPVSILLHSRFWLLPQRPAAAATLLFLFYYTVFVGGRTSSVRAAIMVGLFLLSRIMERDRSVLHTLYLAAFAILLWRPISLFEVDFQLSFAAVTAIILFYGEETAGERTTFLNPQKGKKGRHLVRQGATYGAQLATISLIALAATAPITAVVFHRVTAAGLVSNLLLVPLTGFWIVPWGILSLVLFHVSPALAVVPIKIAAAGIVLMQQTVAWLNSLPIGNGWVFPPPSILVMIYYLALGAVLVPSRLRQIQKAAAMVLLLVLFLGMNERAGVFRPDGKLRMHFLDVGNGSATLLVLPDGATVLIDGGGHYRSTLPVGRAVVLPALLSMGLKQLDVMVLTHPHPDHLKGLTDLVGEVPVGEVWDGWDGGWTEEYHLFRERIEAEKIRRRGLNSVGETIDREQVRFKVMQCGGFGDGLGNTEINNNSLVLQVSMKAVSLLVAGDLEAAGEDRLVERWHNDLKSTILLVPHHGSLTSSQPVFLDAVRPEIAVISAGRDNRFHHPASKVLGRLHYIGPEKKIYRTDRQGAILVETDGKRVITSCFLKGSGP
ncbi:MAG: DNA internalization-related competence protein ComEC/Rec2, partial [bacterium]|nr:DNA internalization-related competence protein ComEC/Rec2 [bacterium]